MHRALHCGFHSLSGCPSAPGNWHRARCDMSNKLLSPLPNDYRWSPVERSVHLLSALFVPIEESNKTLSCSNKVTQKQKVNQIVHVNVTGNTLLSIIDFSPPLGTKVQFLSPYRFSSQHLARSSGLILRVSAEVDNIDWIKIPFA